MRRLLLSSAVLGALLGLSSIHPAQAATAAAAVSAPTSPLVVKAYYWNHRHWRHRRYYHNRWHYWN
ncbi:MAG TPA: hypothetical protein VHB27_06005 [Rhodopila sp.]|uniref:hypothetical protein n=1 Tax=Rhodopila sp. TaxID=2480087 RepID=UPI002C8BD7DA|nr:hypothetical protein [Rhodopila sp.]HVY14759.1 hypothetical protein [Rhodopila sp.]